MIPFELNETGVCSTCNKKISEEKLKCSKCDKFYHATCSTDPICNKTFLKNFITNSANKPNFTWQCDHCQTQSEIDKVALLSQEISSLKEAVAKVAEENSINKLKTQMSDEFALLTECCTSGIKAQMLEVRSHFQQELKTLKDEVNAYPTLGSVYGDRGTAANVVKSSILLKADTDGNPVDQEKLKKVVIDNGIQIDRVVVSSSGDTFVNFPSENQRAKLAPLLQTNNITNDVVTLKSKLPSISLLHVTEEMSKEQIKDVLCSQNESIATLVENGQELSVVFTKPPTQQHTNYQVVLRVSPDIRKAIKSCNNKVHLGVNVCKVVDRFYVRRCNRCQGFGHYASTCKDPVRVVCGYCMGNHDSNDCHLKASPHTEHKCNNCRLAGLTDSGHSTFWYQCPAYIIQQNKLKSSISYDYNSN